MRQHPLPLQVALGRGGFLEEGWEATPLPLTLPPPLPIIQAPTPPPQGGVAAYHIWAGNLEGWEATFPLPSKLPSGEKATWRGEGGKGEGRDSNYWRRDSNYYSFPFTKNPSPLPRIRRQHPYPFTPVQVAYPSPLG